MAVRLVILLLESALVELLQTEGADEVLGVELPEHGSDAASGNGFVTSRAQGAPFEVVVGLAVGLPFMVEEGTTDEGLSAILETYKTCKINNYYIAGFQLRGNA